MRKALEEISPQCEALDSLWTNKTLEATEIISRMKSRTPIDSALPSDVRIKSPYLAKVLRSSKDAQHEVQQDLEDMLLEDEDSSWHAPVEVPVEQRRADLLEKGFRDALFQTQPIISPVYLAGKRWQSESPKERTVSKPRQGE